MSRIPFNLERRQFCFETVNDNDDVGHSNKQSSPQYNCRRLIANKVLCGA